MSYHYHPLENCLARIFYGDEARQNSSCGTGVVLDGGRVLTCAHVVNTALRLPSESRVKPDQIISLDFPLSDSSQRLTAKVVFWDPDTDLAGLELIESLPAEVLSITLTITDELWGHSVQAFGFPAKHELGTWADCKLRGPVASKWVEIIDPITTGNFIQQGFSGGPVWDENLQCCVGIVIAVNKNEDRRVGYLIPAHKIAEKWTELSFHRKSKPVQKRELPALLPYLVNRQKQEEDLFALYKNNDLQSPQPMVAVVHGDDRQAHDMFRLRMASQFIPRLLKINLAHTPITRIPLTWPTYIQRIEDLDAKLVKGLADAVLHVSEASCEDIQHALAAYNSPVIVEMELLTDDWIKHRKGILEAILGFWNNWPALAPNQNLFVFLYVTHTTPIAGWVKRRMYMMRKKQIFRQITDCTFHQFGRIRSTVLSELSNISETEARAWARNEAHEYFNGEITVLMAKIRKIFEMEATIPMEPLAFQLREILTTSSGD